MPISMKAQGTGVSPLTLAFALSLIPVGLGELHGAYIYPRPVLQETFDVDADGRPDVQVRTGSIMANVFPICFHVLPVDGVGLYALNGAQFLTVGASCIPDLLPIAEGAVIGPGLHPETAWLAGGEAYCRQPIPNQEALRWGPMVDLRTLYVGVRIPVPSGYRYGWMKLSTPTEGGVLSVPGFSLASEAGATLLAGQVLAPPPPVEEALITVGADNRTIGGIRTARSTNSVSGSVTTERRLVHPSSVQVLVRGAGGAMEPLYLGPGTLLPMVLPAGWKWEAGGATTWLLRRTERAVDGSVISDAGPLSAGAGGSVALRTGDGVVWWVGLDADAQLVDLGETPPVGPRLLVGQPVGTPGVPRGYLDLDQDGRVDFLYTEGRETFVPPGGNPSSPGWKDGAWLIPMSGNRILSPTTLPLRGGTVTVTPPAGADWRTNRVLLQEVTFTPDSFFGGFSNVSVREVLRGEDGFVGVEFASGAGRKLGWIRLNSHSERLMGTVAGQARFSHMIHLADYGSATGAGEPVVVGANSRFPLALGIVLEGDQLRVTKDPLARNANLETSRTLGGMNWEPLLTGPTDSQLVPVPDGPEPLFLRLRLPTVYPAEH